MNRRRFLRDSAGAAALAGLRGSPLSGFADPKPNIVVIVADDLGYAELGVQGSKDIPSPNIDSIARNGVRFTNGYVSCPVCSPTRAGLITGRYQQRFGHEFNPGPAGQASETFVLSLKETLLPERLKLLGYATGMVGKWHLGYEPRFHPLRRGFDEFFGFLGGAHDYLDALTRSENPILRGTERVDEKEYLTDAFAREAVAFIERRRREPFFLYLTFNAVHAPLQSVEKYLGRFKAISDPKRRTFAAMHSALDDAVGRVLAKLREIGKEQDTLLFFVSDNGGPTPQTSSRNDPLRGAKGTVYEGGIRVPFLVQWKERLPAGKVYEHPVIALDIHPTAVAAAGGTAAGNLDGVDLVPYLSGKNAGRPHESLYWRFGPQWAIRQGDWKLAGLTGEPPQLYNLAADIGEKNDLAARQPEKVRELEAAYEAWNRQLAEPQWRRANPAKKAGARKKR